MRTFLFFAVLALFAMPLFAQEDGRPDPLTPQGENLQMPPTWHVRVDQGGRHGHHGDVRVGAEKDSVDIWFVNMTPGWHVTTGPAAIFYHPASTAEGNFRAETLIHLFDPQGRNEAFGLFIGGTDLDGDAQAYDYFLIRNSSEYLIKRRTGAETSTIQGWTAHEGIETFEESDGTGTNTLAVEAHADEVAFFINGEEVARLPRAEVSTDGIVGLRINHALNVHVEDFKVMPLD